MDRQPAALPLVTESRALFLGARWLLRRISMPFQLLVLFARWCCEGVLLAAREPTVISIHRRRLVPVLVAYAVSLTVVWHHHQHLYCRLSVVVRL